MARAVRVEFEGPYYQMIAGGDRRNLPQVMVGIGFILIYVNRV